MVTLESREKRVIILVDDTGLDLRLFPGHNNVDVEDMDEFADKYLGNKVNVALVKEFVRPIDKSLAKWDAAEAAREKNDIMNKSAVLLMKAEENLMNKEKENQSLADVVKQLQKEMEDLKKVDTSAMEKELAKLKAENAALKKAAAKKEEGK